MYGRVEDALLWRSTSVTAVTFHVTACRTREPEPGGERPKGFVGANSLDVCDVMDGCEFDEQTHFSDSAFVCNQTSPRGSACDRSFRGVQEGRGRAQWSCFVKHRNAEPKHSTDRPVSVRKWNRICDGLARAGQPSVGPVRLIWKKSEEPRSTLCSKNPTFSGRGPLASSSCSMVPYAIIGYQASGAAIGDLKRLWSEAPDGEPLSHIPSLLVQVSMMVVPGLPLVPSQ
jgi:hypothetical protein